MLTASFGRTIGAVTASRGRRCHQKMIGAPRVSHPAASATIPVAMRPRLRTAIVHTSSVAGRMFRRSPRQWPSTRRARSSLADTSSRAMNRLGVTTTESALQVAALLEAAAEGDERAWSELVAQFHGLLWATARACGLSEADAADVTQTTWMRLAETPRSDHRAGGVAGMVGDDDPARGDPCLEACATSASRGPARRRRSRRRPQRGRPSRCGPNGIRSCARRSDAWVNDAGSCWRC